MADRVGNSGQLDPKEQKLDKSSTIEQDKSVSDMIGQQTTEMKTKIVRALLARNYSDV